MVLYLIRHAHAGKQDPRLWPDDGQRPLSDKGRSCFKRTMKKLVKRGIRPQWLATSPLVRCRETAELVLSAMKPAPMLAETSALAPGSDLTEAIALTVREAEGLEQVAWVGHAPDVNQLAAALIGSGAAAIDFAKGAIAAIEFDGPVAAGQGQLRWMVNATVLGVDDN